jgi:hypothetical protein
MSGDGRTGTLRLSTNEPRRLTALKSTSFSAALASWRNQFCGRRTHWGHVPSAEDVAWPGRDSIRTWAGHRARIGRTAARKLVGGMVLARAIAADRYRGSRLARPRKIEFARVRSL